MRGKKFSNQERSKELFTIELEMVSEEVDLIGQKYTGNRAARSTVLACFKIPVKVLVHIPPEDPNP